MLMTYYRTVLGDTLKACEAHFSLSSFLGCASRNLPFGVDCLWLRYQVRGVAKITQTCTQNHPFTPHHLFETQITCVGQPRGRMESC